MSERIGATHRIAAPAGHIFRLITDPAVHVRIDGSGMLVEAGSGSVLRAVGDAFEIEMDREPIGDLPLGRYRVRNNKYTRRRRISRLYSGRYILRQGRFWHIFRRRYVGGSNHRYNNVC